MRKSILLIFVLMGCMAVASADSFSINVLNSTFTGTNSPLPAGMVNATQVDNHTVSFAITMYHYLPNTGSNTTSSNIQYMIGGGGFALDLANTSNLAISAASAVNGLGNNMSANSLVLTIGSHNYDGFGTLNVNIGTTSTSNSASNSLVTLNFTLSRTVGTLAISDFLAQTSSNCGPGTTAIVNTPCEFVMHVNEFDLNSGANLRTGYGGTTGQVVATPEPGGLALLGSGLLGMGGFIRRKLRK